MNKRMKKLAAVGLSAVVTLGGVFLSWPSLAANYTPVTGTAETNPTFQKYMIMRAGDLTPQATFQYTVSAGSARSLSTSNNSEMEVMAGVTPENVTVSDVVFTAGQETFSSASASQIDVQRTDRATIKYESSKGEKFAVSAGTMDFSGVSFPEPGIYRYLITETESSAAVAKGILMDEDADRVLDVYVTDNGSGSLVISAYVLHTEDGAVAIGSSTMGSADVASDGTALSDKTDGFTSEFFSKDLAFTQKVSGNQASRDKYFALSVQISGLSAEDKIAVSLSDDGNANTTDGNADSSITANPNSATKVIADAVTQPSLLTIGRGGGVIQTFYLQDGQSVVLRGLPVNGKYTITENAEDYKATAAVVTGYTDATTSGESMIAAMDTDNDGLVKTSYQNLRSGVIPTGVLLSALPGILAVGAGAIGAAVLLILKARRRREDNE